jgi:hypothetical protein
VRACTSISTRFRTLIRSFGSIPRPRIPLDTVQNIQSANLLTEGLFSCWGLSFMHEPCSSTHRTSHTAHLWLYRAVPWVWYFIRVGFRGRRSDQGILYVGEQTRKRKKRRKVPSRSSSNAKNRCITFIH